MNESDLSPLGKIFLEDLGCTKLYGEIADIDLLGRNDHIVYGLELKKRLNIKVLEQAYNRLKYVNYVWIGVPRKVLRRTGYRGLSKVYRHFLEYYGIGLVGLEDIKISYGRKQFYYEIYHHPRLNRKPPYKDTLNKYYNDMYEDKDGGFRSGDTITPYMMVRDEVLGLAKNLTKRYSAFTIDMILLNADRAHKHYSNPRAGTYSILNNSGYVEKSKDGKRYRWKDSLE